ncbi:MAG: S8 family serine peptidase [Pirellulaceae bacterium]
MTNRYHIPPDFRFHDEYSFAQADSPPYMWHRPDELLKVAKLLENGAEQLKIGIIDTGWSRHKWLPEAQEVFNETDDRSAFAGNMHGVHVWGIIGGLMGIGLVPKAKFYIFKGLDNSGSGASTWLNNCIRKAADVGCHFINGSYGSSQGTQDDKDALNYFYTVGRKNGGGLLAWLAAGNSGYNGRTNTIGWPARWNLGGTVSSYDSNGDISSFSSGGPGIHVAGAGGKIISTLPGKSESDEGTEVGVASGTSMATPDQLAKAALYCIARQAAGLPQLHGPDEWHDDFERLFNEKAIADGGQPGRDNWWGWGQFTTNTLVSEISKLAGLGV